MNRRKAEKWALRIVALSCAIMGTVLLAIAIVVLFTVMKTGVDTDATFGFLSGMLAIVTYIGSALIALASTIIGQPREDKTSK